MEHSHYHTSASANGATTENTAYRATPQDLYNDLRKNYEDAYDGNAGQVESLEWLISALPPGSKVLDLGCGTGRPALFMLSRAGMEVAGVDISEGMLGVARGNVPEVRLIQADLKTFEPAEHGLGDFDAVVAYFSLIGHISQDEIRGVLRKVYSWLRPAGLFVYATVPLEGDQLMCKWMDREFPSSGFSTENSIHEVEQAGFEIVKWDERMFVPKGREAQLGWDGKETAEEGEPHLFVYARKKVE